MGYHSADYDHDWKFSSAELARVIVLSNTSFNGVKTGCYKIDAQSIDGFNPDNQRAIDEPVTLTKYHSADYNRDGRIDEAEVDRFTVLYNYRYTDIPSGGTIRTGQYHDNDPFSLDGFGFGPVYLSTYEFDTENLPIIYSNQVIGENYILRMKLIASDGSSFQTTVSVNNSGHTIEVTPPPGEYVAQLYWIKYAKNGFEGDYDNDGAVTQADVDAIGDIITGILPIPTGSQFQRADCAPRATKGNGIIDLSDVVQAARYKNGLDPYVETGGPGTPDPVPTYIVWLIGDVFETNVTVGAPKENCKSGKECHCGPNFPEPVKNVDKGKIYPISLKISCESPPLPIAPCNERDFYVVATPGQIPPFYIVSTLFDQICDPITDQDDNPILTIIK